eukprot:1664189-Pyramimonas_sp.AAC.1
MTRRRKPRPRTWAKCQTNKHRAGVATEATARMERRNNDNRNKTATPSFPPPNCKKLLPPDRPSSTQGRAPGTLTWGLNVPRPWHEQACYRTPRTRRVPKLKADPPRRRGSPRAKGIGIIQARSSNRINVDKD